MYPLLILLALEKSSILMLFVSLYAFIICPNVIRKPPFNV
ncbi:hypothetical protein 2011_scaffold3_00074 [Bacteriophage sp.]|nr:hypothetical protein 2011_scaffold3_00074 [Bacteriophage sp.]